MKKLPGQAQIIAKNARINSNLPLPENQQLSKLRAAQAAGRQNLMNTARQAKQTRQAQPRMGIQGGAAMDAAKAGLSTRKKF